MFVSIFERKVSPMLRKSLGRVLILVLMLSFVLGVVPASAAIEMVSLEEATAAISQVEPERADKSAQPKYTVKLIAPKSVTLKLGQLKRVNVKTKYRFTPEVISFVVANENIASPLSNENTLLLFGKNVGQTSVYFQSGSKVATTKVKVNFTRPTGITLSEVAAIGNTGNVGNMSVVVAPASMMRSVKWSSDNSKVVKVQSNGEFVCKKPGVAILTCKTKKGSQFVGSFLLIVQ